jgi:hypothetical protein
MNTAVGSRGGQFQIARLARVHLGAEATRLEAGPHERQRGDAELGEEEAEDAGETAVEELTAGDAHGVLVDLDAVLERVDRRRGRCGGGHRFGDRLGTRRCPAASPFGAPIAAHRGPVHVAGDGFVAAAPGDRDDRQDRQDGDGGDAEDEDLCRAHRSKKIPSRHGKVKLKPGPR